MFSISKKVFGLAGVATMFAGMAFGQATCAQTATTGIIRAEGTTELVAPIVITCTAGAGGSVAGTGSLQVFLSPTLPVTSKVLSTTTGATEAVAVVSGSVTQVNATVSGSTLNFSNVSLPLTAPTGTFTITISNIRVNATSLSVGSGVPPSISATTFISGSAGSIIPAALGAAQVAFAQNGLGTAKVFKTYTVATQALTNSGANNFVICNAYSPKIDGSLSAYGSGTGNGKSMLFAVQVNENFTSSFKTAIGEASQVSATVGSTSNSVASGTRLAVNFANVPANVTLYVPSGTLASTGTSTATITPVTSATAALANVVPSTSSSVAVAPLTTLVGSATFGASQGAYAVPVTSGSGTVYFEVTTEDTNNLDIFSIPVFFVTTANTAVASASAITASVSFAPVGGTNIPNFVVGTATTTLTGSTFNACSTSLLFPFVTNQLGFDTGIAISNTSKDPFGTSGATAQAGKCILNFYGSGAPTPASADTDNIPAGTTYPLVVSGVAAGFQGYVIAQCNFQYAHGFAFITNGVGTNGGLSQGYLAGVIPDVNQVSRATTTGEVLGN